MQNFTFYSPTCFVFGKETEQQAGALVRRFGGTKALVKALCWGDGRQGSISGFVTLDEADCTKIYQLMGR